MAAGSASSGPNSSTAAGGTKPTAYAQTFKPIDTPDKWHVRVHLSRCCTCVHLPSLMHRLPGEQGFINGSSKGPTCAFVPGHCSPSAHR